VDILIRNRVHFSHICPEPFLSAMAMRHCRALSDNYMVVYLGERASYLSCTGESAEYFRMFPLAGADLSKTISSAQKITVARANELLEDFLKNPESENRAFLTYYAKQFAQKFRQELKKSELFYCRTFKQPPIGKLYLTGCRNWIYDYFQWDENVSGVDLFKALKHRLGSGIRKEEIDILSWHIGSFVGAAHCIKNNEKNLLNLFSRDFSTQVEFQRQNFEYLLVMVIITLLALTGLKMLKKDFMALTTKRATLEAKLFETDVDVARYTELKNARAEDHGFIKNAKAAVYSQAAWSDFFQELQAKLATLKTAWIEYIGWEDRDGSGEFYRLTMTARMFLPNADVRKAAAKNIERFIVSLADIAIVDQAENIKMSQIDDRNIVFSCDLILKQNSEIFPR
jgi:hypothetical protein